MRLLLLLSLRVCVPSDLGCHIDGYIATLAHTLVVGAESVTGAKADVIAAAYTGLQAAYKCCRAGAKGSEITKAVSRVAEEFGVKGLTGTLSHQMKRYDAACLPYTSHRCRDCTLTYLFVSYLQVCDRWRQLHLAGG